MEEYKKTKRLVWIVFGLDLLLFYLLMTDKSLKIVVEAGVALAIGLYTLIFLIVTTRKLKNNINVYHFKDRQ